MGLGEGRIPGEGSFVRRDRASHITRLRQRDAPPQARCPVVSKRGHGIAHGVLGRGPSSAEPRVLLERAAGIVSPSERSARLRERVVGRTELGEQLNGALEMRNGAIVQAHRGIDSTEPELCRRRRT